MRKLALGLLAILFALTNTALSHAILVSVTPPIHGSVAGAEVVFRLQFNSRIDSVRSTLKLLLPEGKLIPLEMGPQPSPDTLTARTTNLKVGNYRLRWQVLAVDGHITRGEVPFDVR